MTAQTSRKHLSPAVVESAAPDEYTTAPASRALTVVEAPRAPAQATQQGFLLPLDTAESARKAIQAYEELKRAIIQPSDVKNISGKNHIKKSGWLRIARAFGLTVEPVSEEYGVDAGDGSWGYAIVVRAVAPNGASMQGDGMCWSSEKPTAQRTRHNVRAHAYTRATNRAISNLVGGGEVSAEEMQGFIEDAGAPIAAGAQEPERQDRCKRAMADKEIMDLLVARQRFNDADRRAELQGVFDAIEQDGRVINLASIRAELKTRLSDFDEPTHELSKVEMGAPGN
jgi:hypothetical protein